MFRLQHIARALWGTLWAALLINHGPAADRIPVADFARAPLSMQVRLSPDGETLAFLREFGDRTYLCISRIGETEVLRLQIGHAQAFGTMVPKEVATVRWISDTRLLLTTTVWDGLYGAAAVNRDGREWVGITGYESDPGSTFATLAFELVHAFDDAGQRILMLDRNDGEGASRLFPDVIELNTLTGTRRTVVDNPGNVTGWMSDHEGCVRIGMARDDEASRVLYRESDDADWRTLPLPSRGHEKTRPLGFDPTNGNFYVAGFNAEDRWTVFPFDLETGVRGDPLLSDPEYDILGGGFTPTFAGEPLARLMFSEAGQALIGVCYVTDLPQVRWFDADLGRVQAAVDKALRDTFNLLVGQSRDDNRLLFLSFSDRHPGIYHLLDRREKSFKPLGPRMEWIDPARMSPMVPIRYQARDGVLIHGYITVPLGHEPKNLPLVVLPHGGPWIRDTWGFDPLVQLIASRGYAVLQMNYRGSRGYGSLFGMQGTRQVGRAIQDDIDDATRWAIANGVADPKRVAIAGASYGGYSALFALGHSQELYRCGISIAGVTDWLKIYRGGEARPEYRFARRRWVDQIGDPEEDESFLRSISPVYFADRITAPLLMVQGREDRTVPADQARDLVAALKKERRPPEVLFLGDEGHGLVREKSRLAAFEAIVAFLERHLGPGLEFRGGE